MLVTDIIKNSFNNCPDKVALIFDNDQYTYRQLYKNVLKIASFLKMQNINKNDRVALIYSNSPEFIFIHYAIIQAGAISVPIDPILNYSNILKLLLNSKPKAIFIQEKYWSNFEIIKDKIKCIETIVANRNAGEEKSLDNIINYNNAEYDFSDECAYEDDIALIIYSSGTTGAQKGIILTHKNLIEATKNIDDFMQMGNDEVEVAPAPYSHLFGLGRVRTILYKGGTIIIHDGLRKVKDVMESISRHNATGFSSTAFTLSLLLTRYYPFFEKHANNLKYIEAGTSSLEIALKKKLMSLLHGAKLLMSYGLTEASRAILIDLNKSEKNIHCLGKPCKNVTVSIVDDDLNPVKNGKIGEMLIKGEVLSPGYWKNDNAEVNYIDGALRTGDLGKIDSDGNIYYCGRKKDIINVGGFKVAAIEVEEALNMHDEIDESAVIGVRDDAGVSVEVIKAFIVTKNDKRISEEEIIQFCTKHLEGIKLPRIIEFVEYIPKTATGKLQKGKLT